MDHCKFTQWDARPPNGFSYVLAIIQVGQAKVHSPQLSALGHPVLFKAPTYRRSFLLADRTTTCIIILSHKLIFWRGQLC